MANRQRSSIWRGSITFASTMMIIIGVLNVLEGIVTIADHERTIVIEDQLYVINVVGWGILILVFGAILTCAGVGVLSARTWARVTAIVCVSLHAVVQVASLAAYPLWSLLMLALDVLVLYALTAAWHEATTAREGLARPPAYDPRGRQAIWADHPRTFA
jgi:hypothetical protein